MKSKEIKKVIISSTHVDSHGDQMSLQALEQLRDKTNSGRRIRFGVDHNREFPPKGIISNADIIEKDGYHYVIAECREYEIIEEISWDNTLQKEYFEEATPFAEVQKTPPEITGVSADPHNFESYQKYERFLRRISSPEIATAESIRKAAVPNPEIIFTLTKGALIYQILKPFAKKIGEKVADKVADATLKKGEQFYSYLRKVIIEAANSCVPKKQPLMVVFELNGEPQIELLAKTRDHDLILKSLTPRKLKMVKDEIKFLEKNLEIDKIQFILTAKGKWKFNYLLTKQGASVGKKTAIKKRDKRLQIISEGNN